MSGNNPFGRTKEWVITNGSQFFPDMLPWPRGVELREGQYGIPTDRGFRVVQPGDWLAIDDFGGAYLYRPAQSDDTFRSKAVG